MWKQKAERREKKQLLCVSLQRRELLLWSFLFPSMHSASTFKTAFYLPSTLLCSARLMCLFFYMLSIYLWDLLVVRCVMIFFRGVLHTLQVGMKPPLKMQHYITLYNYISI